jgi:hypothetical protein
VKCGAWQSKLQKACCRNDVVNLSQVWAVAPDDFYAQQVPWAVLKHHLLRTHVLHVEASRSNARAEDKSFGGPAWNVMNCVAQAGDLYVFQ